MTTPYLGNMILVQKTKRLNNSIDRIILRPLLNYLGSVQGYGRCIVCGDRYNWKISHVVDYEIHDTWRGGALPTCQECWETKSTEELIAGAEKLMKIWINGGTRDEEAFRMVAAVTQAARERDET